jgi:hypothetical protein
MLVESFVTVRKVLELFVACTRAKTADFKHFRPEY